MTNKTERFGKCAVLPLNTTGFENLSLQKKHLVFHLTEAGLYGRNLFLQQNYEHNLVVKDVLENMFESLSEKAYITPPSSFIALTDYLKRFWIHVGIYHGMSNKRLDVGFDQEEFDYLIKEAGVEENEKTELTKRVLFDETFTKPLKNIQKSGVDVVAESGGNFYKNLTEIEANEHIKKSLNASILFRKIEKERKNPESPLYGITKDEFFKNSGKIKTKDDGEKSKKQFLKTIDVILDSITEGADHSDEKDLPQYGFNSRLVKDEQTGEITEEFVCVDGLYGDLVSKIVENLEKAVEFAENTIQRESIETLITFYKTGSPEDFDTHSLKWVQDQESEIFFINGLIESYDDPKGIRCTFESLVAFKNPIQTEKVNNIIKNIQWFETNMPVDPSFKKDEAAGLSASSVTVAGMAGATSPTLPLGICLPNSDWIREKHGSKSVNLFNVANARGESEIALKDEFFLPQYLDAVKLYGSQAGSLHTDLHEVAGHGSCKSNAGVSNEALDIYYAVIEEARADLVGLYFMGLPELVEFGILEDDIDLEAFTQAAYINYITNGSMLQLKRVDFGDDLAQPHLRNRQLVVNWVLTNDTENCVELTIDIKNGKQYAKINDFDALRTLFGKLLGKIQEIKSTGNFDAAQEIVETYGTKVNRNTHAEVLERVKVLDTPSTYGFTTPLYEEVLNDNGEVIDYVTYQKPTFIEDQLYLSKRYK